MVMVLNLAKGRTHSYFSAALCLLFPPIGASFNTRLLPTATYGRESISSISGSSTFIIVMTFLIWEFPLCMKVSN